MEVGTGKEAASGDFCEVSYQMFTQNGLYLDSVGYGQVSVILLLRQLWTACLSSKINIW